MVTKLLKIVCFCIFVLLLAVPSLAQNTKGDKPAGSNRETRFKTPKKTSQKRKPGKRIKQKEDRASNRASAPRTQTRTGERPGRSIRPMFSKSKPRGEKQKAWKGDISGRKIRARPSGSSSRNVYPQPRYMNYSSRNSRRNARVTSNSQSVRQPRSVQQQDRPGSRRRVMPRSASGSANNVYSQKSIYVNNKSRKPASYQSDASRSARANLRRYPGPDKPRVSARRISPRSASSAYIARRSTNTWAHFKRPKRKSEQATTTDLAGKKLRTKNFETQRPVLTNPTLNYKKRVAVGERPYKGPAAGGYLSRTRSTQRAWKGDVAGYRVRGGQSPRGRDRAFPGFLKGGGFRSASQSGEKRPGGNPLPGRTPGMGSQRIGYQGNIKTSQRRGFGDQGEGYTGNVKLRRYLKGGGSLSGKSWNNKGIPIQGRSPGRGADRVGTYQGSIRAGRRVFNNQGEEYTGNIKSNRRRGFNNQGEEYSGNIRGNRKRGLNDQGEGHTGNIKLDGRRGFSNQGEEYTGNIRTNRRRGFNNQGEEYAGNIRGNRKRGFSDQGEGYTGNIKLDGRRGFSNQGEEYTGNIKGGRPLKGGGSVSGKLWNNKNKPIQVRVPGGGGNRIASYQGNIRAGRKVFNNQGEEYTGNIKARKPLKGGGSISGKLWNNDEKPIVGKDFSSQSAKVSGFSGNMKAKRPEKGGGSISGKLWNNDEKPIAVRPPKNDQGEEFSGNLKLSKRNYSKNPNSADDALKGRRPEPASVKAAEFSRGIRRTWDYIKNPSSADESQRVREPGKAFARSTDFQGNIKMRKHGLFNKQGLHPDARFVKLNKNNVAEEKDMLTNFKLWWARLFKKSDTQPDHLKDKERKPRYDKGESGLWYE